MEQYQIGHVILICVFCLIIGLTLTVVVKSPNSTHDCKIDYDKVDELVADLNIPYVSDSTTLGELKHKYTMFRQTGVLTEDGLGGSVLAGYLDEIIVCGD